MMASTMANSADNDSEPSPQTPQEAGKLGAVAAARAAEIAKSRRHESRVVPQSLRERYDDIRFLGEGGMGTVFRAFDPRLGRTVALKLLKHDNPDLWPRFLQEARAQARIQHQHVCRVYDTGEADGEPFIVMQYIDGEPLGRAMNAMSLEQKVGVMREVAGAVHEAHRLGIIHRDIKPGNILVERLDDGALKPYVMDFGLAREVADKGQTATGDVLGTPAYMPPEQAMGDIRSLDRRSDVYSLGATFYELLAGQPPFVAEHAWNLLLMVAYQDAPALSKVKKNIPVELEVITMKCLEREPGRRYDSARAFGDDLQRFLDGEPILAKRAGMSYVVWKKVQKNKLATLFLALAVILSVVFFGIWRKGKIDAIEQARLAQELGKDVTEMESFLRNAYAIPLHDVERERTIIRKRLSAIEQRMAKAGDVGEGPRDYAIGRGYLALEDPDKAYEHLAAARSAEYASPDLDYALGKTLGELYRRGLDNAKRIQNKEEQKAEIARLEVTYRDPALIHLRAALPAQIEVSAYAEGLIAYYEGKYEDALIKAKQAFEQAPWLYEAKKLEADALFMLGSRFRHDADFDWDKMMQHFGPAAEAYQAAADIARSSPEVHRAECELWFQIMCAAAYKKTSPFPAFEKAKSACSRAIKASSAEKQARLQLAHVHSAFAFHVSQGRAGHNEDPLPYITEAIVRAEEVVLAIPSDPMAHFVQGNATWAQISYDMERRIDPKDALDRAIAAYESALRLDPRFLWALTELAQVRYQKMTRDAWLGIDVASSVENAINVAGRAITLDETSPIGPYTKALPYVVVAEQLVEMGKSPQERLVLATQAADESRKLAPKAALPLHLLCRIQRIQAMYDIASGAQATESIGKAMQCAKESEALAADASETHESLGGAELLGAIYSLREKQNPVTAVERSRNEFRRAIEKDAVSPIARIGLARVEVIAIQWAMQQHKVNAAMFDAARKPIAMLVAQECDDPSIYEMMAEIAELEEHWHFQEHLKPDNEITQGLVMVDKALAKNPHMASALATRAQLHLGRARATHDAATRINAARQAKTEFESAFQNNPLLERLHREELKEVAAFL